MDFSKLNNSLQVDIKSYRKIYCRTDGYMFVDN